MVLKTLVYKTRSLLNSCNILKRTCPRSPPRRSGQCRCGVSGVGATRCRCMLSPCIATSRNHTLGLGTDITPGKVVCPSKLKQVDCRPTLTTTTTPCLVTLQHQCQWHTFCPRSLGIRVLVTWAWPPRWVTTLMTQISRSWTNQTCTGHTQFFLGHSTLLFGNVILLKWMLRRSPRHSI